MSTVAVDDLRHEMDENVAASAAKRKPSAAAPKPTDVKTSFLIRTLPRDCNPTPVPTCGLNASASGLLSPMRGKLGGRREAELEVLLLDNPFDDITEEKLKQLTGSQDLEQITSLQISVDSSKQSVEVIGELLPSLQQLRLQQSALSSFRDLGTSLRSLRILWAMHCHISDLDGIGALMNLQELYLQHNNVSDISPLTMHDELRIVDLEGNRVTDIGQTEQLACCPQLTSLNLAANPVETVEGYRQIIANFVPQLVSLDDRAFSDSERVKLSDFDIDAAILKHHEQHRQDLPRSDSATYLRVAGPNEINSPRQLSYSSSSASLNGLPIDSSLNEDSGSRLTHGTDIVFAGNVSSALRRHRNEAETGDLRSSTGGSSEEYASPVVSRPSSSQGLPDRPKTPARRISITDTLDRARELDTQKLKSRDAILNELKSWQLDSVGTSQVGVSRDTDKALHTQSNEVLSHSTSRRKGSVDGIRGHEITTLGARARIERRPNTSAGVLRNGSTVREAFVESTTGKSIRPTSRGGSSGQRSSSQDVDIRILDGGDDSKRPCSPTKTPRGIFTTASSSKGALGRNHEWNLEVLSPKVDITTAKRHLPSSLTSKQQLERSQRRSSEKRADEDTSSDSDADDESSVCPAVATEFGSPTLVPKTAFFNVAESLNAIEKWRDKMEYDAEDTAILSIASLQQSCLSPRGIAEPERINMTITIPDGGNAGSGNQQHSPTRQHPQEQKLALGPGNHESDHHNVKLLKEKNSQLKTRDGFRSYFRGIEQGRLEGILRQAFADHDKVQRRMHLMSGYFRHELQC